MATQTNTKQTQKPTTRLAWQYACTDEDGRFSECGYLIRNHDKAELVRFSQKHAKDSHQVDAPANFFDGAATQVAF